MQPQPTRRAVPILSVSPSPSRCLIAAILTLTCFGAPALAQVKARDKTVGACTRKAEFARRQTKVDELIQELVRADVGDKARLGRAIADRYGESGSIECVIRYREKDMRHVLLPLLEAEHWPVVARALYGLKMVGVVGGDADGGDRDGGDRDGGDRDGGDRDGGDRDDGEDAAATAVVHAVAKCLRHADARVRELAANCLCHIGGKGSAAALQEALGEEKDRFARASMQAAIAVLQADDKPYRPFEEKLTGPDGARRVEWDWLVKGRRLFNDYDAKTLDYPAAESFDWPISWYEGSLFIPFPRSSFGGKSGHTGEDMAWFREGCSVFAVADGLVRMVQGAGGNWGFLVLIEHRLKGSEQDGHDHVQDHGQEHGQQNEQNEQNEQYVCSLYGHLGFDVLVKPGDVVKKGQKIGTVGLSCSIENGGYGAHLHFGLADGPFRKPKGIYKDGTSLNFDYNGKRVKAPVIGYMYMPKKPDENGFPGLGVRVRIPDGKVLEMHVGNVPMRSQIGWITGYLKGCRGWFDPYEYLKPRVEPRGKPDQGRKRP